MCDFLAAGGLLILYGILSGKPAGNIKPLALLMKGIRIESFMLGRTQINMDHATLTKKAQDLMKSELKSHISRKYPLSEFKEAI